MDWKKLGKSLLYPPVWLIVLLTVASSVLLTWIFAKGLEEAFYAYGVYILAFYTLTAVCAFAAKVLPGMLRKHRENRKIYHTLAERTSQVKTSLLRSLCFHLVYVLINLWSWYTVRSWWFVVLAVYYGIMVCMRLLLLGYVRKYSLGGDLVREWKRARICAYILLLVNLSLSGAVLMILYQSKGHDYPGIMIYVMALYTFYSTIHAIVDIVRYRRLGSPILSTAKIVSLCAALVSMLNLETAMFAQFGQELTQQDQRIFIILTGAGVSVAVVTFSALLIVNAAKEIRRMKNGE